MIVSTAAEFRAAYGDGSRFPPRAVPCLRAVLLVSPHGFAVSPESATDNAYMSAGTSINTERAHAQHLGVARKLLELGVPVLTFPGHDNLPDGIYPNNAFATANRHLIVGSMCHPQRRRETAREDIRSFFTGQLGYGLRDLSGTGVVAELTGPLVIDRARQIGFCGLSSRADRAGCGSMHEAFELELTFCFELVTKEYHTNLILAVLAGRACVLYPESFRDPEVPAAVASVYGFATVRLDDAEKNAFAGNCIALGERDVLFSQTALQALRPSSRATLEAHGFELHAVEIDELEKGGGSLRCLIAEVF